MSFMLALLEMGMYTMNKGYTVGFNKTKFSSHIDVINYYQSIYPDRTIYFRVIGNVLFCKMVKE